MQIQTNKSQLLRKNITINSDDFDVVNSFAKKIGMSFSELMRKAALHYVEEQENMDLADFLRANCPSVPADEEYELIEALKNLDEDDFGEEIDIEKYVQSSL